MDEQSMKYLIEKMSDLIDEINNINKRLILVVIASVACFCILIAVMTTVYFTADYPTYPDVNQQQQQVVTKNGTSQQQQN